MHLIALNANTTAFVTDTVAAEMRRTLGPGVSVSGVTPAFGPAVIRTGFENTVAGHAVLEAAANHAAGADGIVLAVSFDTGLSALREALAIPVVGISEATVAMARMVGGRIGYVSLGLRSTPLYRTVLATYGIERDIAGWRSFDAPSAYAPGDTGPLDATLAGAAAGLAAEGADVVVLLGAVLAGASRRVQDRVPVPVLDGGRCGALMARAMVELGAPKATVGAFAPPEGGTMAGVALELARIARGATSA